MTDNTKRSAENMGLERIKIVCKACEEVFEVTPYYKKRKYCSLKCRRIGMAVIWVKTKCLVCEKPFSIQPVRKKTGRGKYCSRKCMGKDYSKKLKGRNHHNYKGGLRIHSYGKTKMVEIQGIGGDIALHRQIAAITLGRKLLSSEVVHHIDGNGLNNKRNNLLICTRSYHSWLHLKMKGAAAITKITDLLGEEEGEKK